MTVVALTDGWGSWGTERVWDEAGRFGLCAHWRQLNRARRCRRKRRKGWQMISLGVQSSHPQIWEPLWAHVFPSPPITPGVSLLSSPSPSSSPLPTTLCLGFAWTILLISQLMSCLQPPLHPNLPFKMCFNEFIFFLFLFISLAVLDLSCGMRNLWSQHVRAGFPTRDWTQAPCPGSMGC